MGSRKSVIAFAAVLLLTAGFALGGNGTEMQWQQLKTLRGISTTTSGAEATTYVFFDPNCPVSAKLNKNGVSIPGLDLHNAVWIPVAYMQPSSSTKSAALLRSGKYEAIIKNYQNYNRAKYEGSIAGVTPTFEESQELDKSKAAWTAMTSTPATPMIIYKDQSGAVKIQIGVPRQLSNGAQQGMGAYNE